MTQKCPNYKTNVILIAINIRSIYMDTYNKIDKHGLILRSGKK